MSILIREMTGTYYTGYTPIGPMFGGTWHEAKRFHDKVEAVKETIHHGWGLVEWRFEEEFGEIFQYNGKWGFHDETWSEACGPFDSREEAVTEMTRYARFLEDGAPYNLSRGTSWKFGS